MTDVFPGYASSRLDILWECFLEVGWYNEYTL